MNTKRALPVIMEQQDMKLGASEGDANTRQPNANTKKKTKNKKRK
jgi:hypothetical protein